MDGVQSLPQFLKNACVEDVEQNIFALRLPNENNPLSVESLISLLRGLNAEEEITDNRAIFVFPQPRIARKPIDDDEGRAATDDACFEALHCQNPDQRERASEPTEQPLLPPTFVRSDWRQRGRRFSSSS